MAFNINKSDEEVKSAFDISKGGEKPPVAGKDADAPKSKLIWILGVGVLIICGFWFLGGDSEPNSTELAEVSKEPTISQPEVASSESTQQSLPENSEPNDANETAAINADTEEERGSTSNAVATTNAATSNTFTEETQDEPQIPEIPSLNFARSGADLQQRSNDLNEFIQYLKSNNSQTLEIIGYASSEGNNAFNVMLSKKRAQTVADLIIAEGISADRIDVKGAGSSNPIATNKTEQGRSKNRRVEITLK